MSTVTEAPTAIEMDAVERANATGLTPAVFIHGLWLLAGSWERFAEHFEEAGFAAVTPGWPDDPPTVHQARANPQVFAGKTVGQIADHLSAVIARLERKPVVIGHSFGGLLTMIVAGRGLSAASVAISPAPFRGVLPVPFASLRTAAPVVANPLNRTRAKGLTYKQFRYSFANRLQEAEAKELYDTYAVAGPGAVLFQAVAANLNPFTEAKVDAKNPERGPLLLVGADGDHTVPWAVTHAAYKRQRHNPGVTEIVKLEGRGHSLCMDSGWREVADRALGFVTRYAG